MLFDCNGTIQLLNETDTNGLYGFSDLEPGSYVVKFSSPTGYQMSNIWSGLKDDDGTLVAPDVDSDADPETASTACGAYEAREKIYVLDAGMFFPSNAEPTPKPTRDPLGDGTPCSGAKCPDEKMCRNKAGICGSGLTFCTPESLWRPDCPTEEKVPTLPPSTNVDEMPPGVPSSEPSSPLTSSSKPSTMAPSVNNIPSVCNDDGSVGETSFISNGDNSESVYGVLVNYTIDLQSESGNVTKELVAQFEQELNRRMACLYFDDPCLNCESKNGASAARLRRRLPLVRKAVVDDSSVTGLSSEPDDVITSQGKFRQSFFRVLLYIVRP